MIKISLNGEELLFEKAPTLVEVLERMEIPRQFIAVERNGDIFEGDFAECVLSDGDNLEIARFVGGG